MLFPGALPVASSASASATLAAAGHTALHNTDRDEIRAIATKLGIGASTPTAGKVLTADGTGTSSWSQVNLTTMVSGALPIANGGTGAASAAAARTSLDVYATAVIDAAIEAAKVAMRIPVGSLYINKATSENPATLLGYGTWTQLTDTMIMAVGGTYGEGTTGGAATHTLTADEMPSHSHAVSYQAPTDLTGSGYISILGQSGSATTNNDALNTITATGGGAAHNNLPPYTTAYVWERTA